MARPTKNNADYFSHDSDMRNDERIMAVRRKFGHVGYSIWNMLLEKLCKSDFFQVKYDDISIEFLAGDFDISTENFIEIIDYFLKIGLVQKDSGHIFSSKLIERFQPLIDKRNRDKDRLSTAKTEQEEVIASEKPHSKVKQIKENKIKEKEILLLNTEEYIFVNEFINKENPQIRYQIEKQGEDVYLQKQYAEIEKLKTDGYSLEAIQTVLAFIKQDSFWYKNILSIKKLREKDKNGIPYIVRMVDEIQKWKPINKIGVLPGFN